MRTKRIAYLQGVAVLLLVMNSSIAKTWDVEEYIRENTVKKDFAIIGSTRKYDVARAVAHVASTKLGVPVDLHGLSFEPKIGLTLSKEDCDVNGWEFPSNFMRGRDDDGIYLSIEYVDSLAKDKYVVVLASGPQGDELITWGLALARSHYRKAYVRTADVYLGCLH